MRLQGSPFAGHDVLNRLFVGAVGLLLVGLAIAGLRSGTLQGRSGLVRRADQPGRFWPRVATYLVVGLLALAFAARLRL